MRSKHVEDFNHDPWAGGYDADVWNEGNPIRTGYESLLAWVAGQVPEGKGVSVVDLGVGTGNLTVLLPDDTRITAVDTSAEMIKLARKKLATRAVTFVQEDILAYVTSNPEPVDAIVSTYALHHLTAAEKKHAMEAMTNKIRTGGCIVIGDLMFESAEGRAEILKAYVAADKKELVTDIEDEFFWNLEIDNKVLTDAGFNIQPRRFSELSWGFVANAPAME
jgi:putative AdoMet-dependent methyltransferase